MRTATREAIIARLVGQVFVTRENTTEAEAVAILDHVPQDNRPAMPYVLVAGATVEAMDTDDSDGAGITTELVIYSSYAGTSEAAGLADQIQALLHHHPLAVVGANCFLVTAEAGEVRDGNDGITHEATVSVRALLDDIINTTV